MDSIGQAAQFSGWTLAQYGVAAQWLHDNGISIPYSGKRVDDQHFSAEEATDRMAYLLRIQVEWQTRFRDDPMKGPMQVYQPELDSHVLFRVKIAWVHASIAAEKVCIS